MTQSNEIHYIIDINNFDDTQLTQQGLKPRTPEYREAISRDIQAQFSDLGGSTRIIVDDEKIEVFWLNSDGQDIVDHAIEKLNQGDICSGMNLLFLAFSKDQDNIDILYNLGMVLSDKGELENSISLLDRCLQLSPDHNNARVALGVAYARSGDNVKAIQILKQAIETDSNNPWARRNYGGCLLKQGENEAAKLQFEKATKLLPNDQPSWFGLAQAYEALGDLSKADNSYKKVLELDEYSAIAEMSREKRSAIAQKVYDEKTPYQARPDALFYCIAALNKFKNMSKEQVQSITFEIAMLGRRGFDVNDPAPKYKLKTMDEMFSGLHLVCYMYVGFQIINPDLDIGFDLKKEYEQAKTMCDR